MDFYITNIPIVVIILLTVSKLTDQKLTPECNFRRCSELKRNASATVERIYGSHFKLRGDDNRVSRCYCRAYEIAVHCLDGVFKNCTTLSKAALDSIALVTKEYRIYYSTCTNTSGSACALLGSPERTTPEIGTTSTTTLSPKVVVVKPKTTTSPDKMIQADSSVKPHKPVPSLRAPTLYTGIETGYMTKSAGSTYNCLTMLPVFVTTVFCLFFQTHNFWLNSYTSCCRRTDGVLHS